MKSTIWICILALLVLGGCASSPMTIAPEQTLPPVKSNEAQVVFLRTSNFGGAISASLFQVTEAETDYLGISAVGTKIAVKTSPGEHLFMVVSEAADFMKAVLEGGKTYYAMVTPRMGAWKARFSLWPVKRDANAEYSLQNEGFQKQVDGTKLLVQSQKSLDWYEEHKADIDKKKAEYLPVWNQKTSEALAARTLTPEDGTR